MNIIVDRGDLKETYKQYKIEDITANMINFRKKNLELIKNADCIIYVHKSKCKVLKHRNMILIDPVCDICEIPSVIYNSLRQNPELHINLHDSILSLIRELDVNDIIRMKRLIEKEGFEKL